MKVVSIFCIVFGALVFLNGLMFKVMHWPDLFKGYYSGPIIFILGLIVLVIVTSKRKKRYSKKED